MKITLRRDEKIMTWAASHAQVLEKMRYRGHGHRLAVPEVSFHGARANLPAPAAHG
jgi:hypothetical protein